MEFISGLLAFLSAFLALPLDAWHDGDHVFAIVLGFVMAIIILATAALIWFVIDCIYSAIKWRIERRPCQHCDAWTTDFNQSEFGAECDRDQVCCNDCTTEHRSDEEPRITCGKCQTPSMQKVAIDDIVIDTCSNCGAVTLDKGELDDLRQISYDVGYAGGQSAASASGLATGIALGSTLNNN